MSKTRIYIDTNVLIWDFLFRKTHAKEVKAMQASKALAVLFMTTKLVMLCTSGTVFFTASRQLPNIWSSFLRLFPEGEMSEK